MLFLLLLLFPNFISNAVSILNRSAINLFLRYINKLFNKFRIIFSNSFLRYFPISLKSIDFNLIIYKNVQLSGF
jgi:hypothetical protein